MDGMTFNLVAVRHELGELKRNNLDTYALVQKMYSVVEALERNITHMQSHAWKEKMNSSSKDVQNSKNESSGQNFVEKGDEFGVKIAEIKDKIEDACDENLSLKNLFVYRKQKENQIFHNVVKKDKAMDAVDFVDLVSSVEVDAIEDKKIISCYAEYLTRKESLKQDNETRNWFLPTLFGQIVANVSGVSTIDRSEIEISVRKHNICEFYMGALKRCEKLHALDLVLLRDIAFNFPSDWYFADFDILYPNNVPIQPNGNDCGLYVMKFMETPCEMLFPTYKYESDEERFRLALLLVNGDANEVRDSVIQKALSFRGPKTNVIATSKVRTKVASQKKHRSINKVRTVIGTGEYLKKPGRKSN
ncbi:hypothetical protein WN944_014205 [Citrus x changshan-huyou]|uniref:Ubiquitin-like protease family profile domain-containing protein n=1 Tax=Citrus x changshan-huyou TaxID=2935761 RepID=A0AAP0M7Z1_9ROSI